MADISAKDVMKLRHKTGLAMMDCKKALQETDGDIESAERHLRKRLKGKMETKLDRVAGEGRIGIAINDDQTAAAIIELRAETDFTAKNDMFIEATNKIAAIALEQENAGDVRPTDSISSIVDDLRISTGENISLGRAHKALGEAGKTSFGSYIHHDGKTGVLIVAQGDISDETLRQLCMHVTAAVPRPLAVMPDDIPNELVEKERSFRVNQAVESGKPKEIAEKIVQGGMRKFFEEVALIEQPFVMDQAKKVKDVVGDATINAFYRWQVGETVDA